MSRAKKGKSEESSLREEKFDYSEKKNYNLKLKESQETKI